MTEIALHTLELASRGNIEAFEKIYKATSSFVYNVALKITHNSTDAEDVTQDVFMKIHNSLKNFEFRSTFKTWVYRITVNTAINRYHKSARENKNRVDYESVTSSLASNSSTDKSALQSDAEDRLNALLNTLSLEHRTCLILRELEGLSYEEIASSLNIPINTVRSRLKRGREALIEKAQREAKENEL